MASPHLVYSTSANDCRNGVVASEDVVQAPHRSTFGEMLLDSPFETVMPTAGPYTLQLHVREGTHFYTASQVEWNGQVYVAAKLNESLMRAIRFPSTSEDYVSTASLVESIVDFICKFGKTTRDEANFLVAFAVSTWFVDCFQVAPSLHLTGPRARVHLIMRLLACVCRRSLLLGFLDLAALRTLPEGLDATLLIHDENRSRNVARILDLSRNRELSNLAGKNSTHARGARVLFSDPMSLEASELRVHLAPIEGGLPRLGHDAEKKIAGDFQAKLLRYRIVWFDNVRNADIEFPEVSHGMQDDVRALTIPLMECGDLIESVSYSFVYQTHEVAGARFTELNCLVIEAALCFCHLDSAEKFFVKEITDVVNAILEGRDEEPVIKSKEVGQALRGLGLFAQRVTKGYRVVLTNTNRERIHRLAREYNVASVRRIVPDCDQCEPPNITPS